MKMTEPYSPIARAKARANPVMIVGSRVGAMMLRKVRNRPAPSVAATSSTSRSMCSSTGCSVRTTNGSPTKVSAITTPNGVKAPWKPSGTRKVPNQPFGAKRFDSVRPATAVGGARAVVRGQPPEVVPRQLEDAQEKPGDGNKDDRAQVKERVAHRQTESRQHVEFLCGHERGDGSRTGSVGVAKKRRQWPGGAAIAAAFPAARRQMFC